MTVATIVVFCLCAAMVCSKLGNSVTMATTYNLMDASIIVPWPVVEIKSSN